MLRKIFRRPIKDTQNSTVEKKKIGWSERFFIFAAVMFLLGWASTGIMSNAKNMFELSSRPDQRQDEISQSNQELTTIDIEQSGETPSLRVEAGIDSQQQAADNKPLSQSDVINDTDPISTPETQISDAQPQVSNPLNWGDWYCANCVAVPVHVKLTHYWPPLGGDNCWTFYDDYCYSPTKSSVPWETVIEISAACPVPWLGSVVEIPALERRYLCLDTGDKVLCRDGTCIVDILTNKIYPWDGLEFDAIVYYPQVWVEPVPTFTPVSTPGQ